MIGLPSDTYGGAASIWRPIAGRIAHFEDEFVMGRCGQHGAPELHAMPVGTVIECDDLATDLDDEIPTPSF